MRRRDFTAGLLLAAGARTVRAQEPGKHHRIAIVVSTAPAASINDTENRIWQAFFAELRLLGDVEGLNLSIERYSGEGRPAGFADLAREVVRGNPEVIVAIAGPITSVISATTGTIPIVASGTYTGSGVMPSLARPGGNMTGVRVEEPEIYGKRLQILKEAVPSASKVAFLLLRGTWELNGQRLREMSRRLQISLVGMPVEEATPSEYQRVFAEISPERPDAIIVHDRGDLLNHRQLIVELINNNRLPAMYGSREFIEVGGLMAYQADQGEAGRRMADDVHEILNGANPGDIPIYQATKFTFVINLKAAKALGLIIPPTLLAVADEVIE